MPINCHRGLPLGPDLCLCPPSYSGAHCQFQTDRISVHISFQFREYSHEFNDEAEFFRLIATLRNERNETVDQEELVLHYLISQSKHVFYLVYSNSIEEHLSYSICFDIYRITINSVQFLLQEIHPIQFGFLPVNRLALIINLSTPLQNQTRMELSNRHTICSLGRYGRDCQYQYDPCRHSNPCLNGGTCYPFDLRLTNFHFICLCSSSYYGQRCEYHSARILIDIPASIQKQFSSSIDINTIPIVVIYFADIDSGLPRLIVENHQIFSNIKYNSSILPIHYRQSSLSDLLFAQLFYNNEQNDYFLIGLHKHSIEYSRTSILTSHRCLHINETLLWQQHNLTQQWNYLERIKFYYPACYQIGLQCFYDEYSMCICENEGRFECLQFNHSIAHCSSLTPWYCRNNGQCRQSSSKRTFACACPKCYYGDLCQFTTLEYMISIDALEMNTVLFMISCLVFVFGTGMNCLSIAVFLRPKSCKTGCGLYLRTLSFVGQIGLTGFFFKLTYLYWKWSNYLTLCIGLEFLLTVAPWIYDWLTVCVTIERAISCAKGMSFNQRFSKHIAKRLIGLIISINVLMNFHESFYRRLILDPRSNQQSWCVVDYPKNLSWLISLRKIINIFHITMPFLINFISTLILLWYTIARKQILDNFKDGMQKKSFAALFLHEIQLIKHCFISPCLLLLFALPRLIFVFTFSCIEHAWQENIYLISYFISILSMTVTLFIFILPSTVFCNELKKTRVLQLCKRKH